MPGTNLTTSTITTTTGDWGISGNMYYSIDGSGNISGTLSQGSNGKRKIKVDWYFKLLKKKLNTLENIVFDRRLKKIEELWGEAVESGQDAFAERLLRIISEETRKSILYAKGYKSYIKKDDVWKYKNNILDGHISDTKFKDYPCPLPKDVLQMKKEATPYFDEFVILHYYNPEIEKKLQKREKLTPEEIRKKSDPILFGIIKEAPEEWFFICDWITDEDKLTLEDLLDADVEVNKITKTPNIE